MYVWQSRLFALVKKYQWPILGGLWIGALILGFIGFSGYFSAAGEKVTSPDVLYFTLQLFTLESGGVTGPLPWELQAARLLAPAAAVYSAISALGLVFREQSQRLILQLTHDHIVICGLGRRGFWLAKAFRARGNEVVGIDISSDNPHVDQCKELGIYTLVGSASDPDLLRQAGIQRASYLICLCGDDGLNAEVAVLAERLVVKRKKNPLRCIIQIMDPLLERLLRVREIGMVNQDSVRLEVLNIFERGARKILQDHPPFRKDECGPHVLLVGAGRLGESLLVQTAHQWRHFAGYDCEPAKITIVDRNASVRQEYFNLKYPFLQRVCTIRALELDVTKPAFIQGDFLRNENGEIDVSAIYVCLDRDTLAVNTALSLLEATAGSPAPIVVRMSYHGGLAALLEGGTDNHDAFGRLRAFCLLTTTWTPELVLGGLFERLARELHQHYLDTQAGKVSDDPAMAEHWDLLPPHIQKAFRKLADQIIKEFHTVGFAIEPLARLDAADMEFSEEEIDTLARLKHDYYTDERLSQRWIYLPLAGDWEGDTTPSPVSWQFRRPEVQTVFRNMVRRFPRLLADMDFQVSRMG